MAHTQKYNHPKPGEKIRVDPIKDKKDIAAIKKLLANHKRDLAIFTLGINTNLRASDLVRLRVGDVRHLKAEASFTICEKKTNKERLVTINKTTHRVLDDYFKKRPATADDKPLFLSQRRPYKGLTVNYLHKLVKRWCSTINLTGNFGSHSLRKTFGYHHRKYFGTDLPTLMKAFNHATQQQTMDYLGIEDKEVHQAFLQEI